jgi:hypothetical protein
MEGGHLQETLPYDILVVAIWLLTTLEITLILPAVKL